MLLLCSSLLSTLWGGACGYMISILAKKNIVAYRYCIPFLLLYLVSMAAVVYGFATMVLAFSYMTASYMWILAVSACSLAILLGDDIDRQSKKARKWSTERFKSFLRKVKEALAPIPPKSSPAPA